MLRGMDRLGALVRSTRERKGMRAADLAYRIGKDPSYVSKLERDLMKEIPDPATIHALAEVLGIAEPRLLEAIGYVVAEPTPEPLPADSVRAEVMALVPGMTERRARALLALIRYFEDEDEDANLSDPPVGGDAIGGSGGRGLGFRMAVHPTAVPAGVGNGLA